MEIEKEAFSSLMEYYKLLPLEDKKKEIINELEDLISAYSKICVQFKVVPNMMLNKEILNLKDSDDEEKFLHAVYAYINTLQDISAQFIEKMATIIKNEE